MTGQDTANSKLTLLGFGEAGQYFSKEMRSSRPVLAIRGFDRKTNRPDKAAFMHNAYKVNHVDGCDTIGAALAGAGVILSLVTADQALAVATEAASTGRLSKGALYFDGNSCAPEHKRAASRLIEAAGGRYVDMAIMAPVGGTLDALPVLISGPHTEAAYSGLTSLGLSPRTAGDQVGRASTIKMLRSVVIKGLEALMLESLLAARAAGVEDEVITSLDASFPGHDWRNRATYAFERVTTHGIRRAEEMRAAAQTLADMGLPGDMAKACVSWQDRVGSLGLDPQEPVFATRADAILGAVETSKTTHKGD